MSIMGGKNLPIDQIVERLRTTDVTLTALMTEYHVGYKTLVSPICAAIGKTAFAALMKQRLRRGGRYTRFRPGHKTWNAGMKGWCPPGCRATQFRPGAMRGNAARRYRGIGSVVVRVGDLDRCANLAAAWNLWDAYTDAVATLAGAEVWKTTGDDAPCRSDLHWWWHDNLRGKGGMKVKAAAAWKKARLIRTVDDLCKLIEADLEQ